LARCKDSRLRIVIVFRAFFYINFVLYLGDLQADTLSISSRQSAVSSSIGGRSGGLDNQSVTSSGRGAAEDSQSVASSVGGGGGGGASSLTSGASQVTLEDNWRPQNSLPSYSQVASTWYTGLKDLYTHFVATIRL
jgi:hypothetical protein